MGFLLISLQMGSLPVLIVSEGPVDDIHVS
jgi:hypothetical protein